MGQSCYQPSEKRGSGADLVCFLETKAASKAFLVHLREESIIYTSCGKSQLTSLGTHVECETFEEGPRVFRFPTGVRLIK